MDIKTMHLVLPQYVWEWRRSLKILPKNGINWSWYSFQEIKNVKFLTNYARHTMDERRRPIAIGHLCNSSDLKIQNRDFSKENLPG